MDLREGKGEIWTEAPHNNLRGNNQLTIDLLIRGDDHLTIYLLIQVKYFSDYTCKSQKVEAGWAIVQAFKLTCPTQPLAAW